MTRFAFVDRETALYDVTVLCQLLKVSRSGFYAWLSRTKSTRALADEVLTRQIREAFIANRSVYGSPRIHTELADDGGRAGRKRSARLMREAGIVGCHRRKRSFRSPSRTRRRRPLRTWSTARSWPPDPTSCGSPT